MSAGEQKETALLRILSNRDWKLAAAKAVRVSPLARKPRSGPSKVTDFKLSRCG